MTTYPKAAPRRGDPAPYSEMTERALIGAILLDGEQAWSEDVADLCAPEDFFTPEHRAVYAAEIALYRRGWPITAPTVCWELRHQGTLEEVDRLTGGAEPYIAHLMGDWMLAAHGCSAWARIIHEYAEQRRGVSTERRSMAL